MNAPDLPKPLQFIDLKSQYSALRESINGRIQTVLDHGQYIMGPEVKELEDRLAKYTGARHCVTVASGTEALLIALMALGVKAGDEVITSPFTFVATAEVIVLLGAKPVYVDIEPDTCNIDANLIESKITARTRAIMPVSLYGQVPNMDEINAVAARHGNIPVIEDAAQSFGASYQGRKSGHLSTIGCTSFFPSKPLGCYGDGGALFTDDDALAQACREIRVHGQSKRYHHTRVGVGGRMDTLQCAIVLAKLDRFEWEVERRLALGDHYRKLILSSGAPVGLLAVRPDRDCVWAQYTVFVDQRDSLQQQLQSVGVPTAVHYPKPLHRQPAYADLCCPDCCPLSDQAAQRVMSLPMSADLSFDQQQRVIDALTRFSTLGRWQQQPPRRAATGRSAPMALNPPQDKAMLRCLRWALVWAVFMVVTSCGGGANDSPPPVPMPVPQSIAKAAGDGQRAAPGTAVVTAPEILVQDSAGAPMAGIEVSFVVGDGGGQVQAHRVPTDAAGRASAGSWTLGLAKGFNSLTASVKGLAPITFSALAANHSADVSIKVLAPSSGQTVGETIVITATVASTYQLDTVTATAGAISIPMTYGPVGAAGSNAWIGTLPQIGVSRGSITLVVTATDVRSNTSDSVQPLTLDRAPVLLASAPGDGALARPKVKVVADCIDDDPAGCNSLTASIDGTVLARGRASLSEELDLSAYEGRRVSLVTAATDSSGQQSSLTRSIFVESSPRLAVVAEVNGPIWDVSGSRILFLDTSAASPALKILDRMAGTTQTLETGTDLLGTPGCFGFLTPTGAIYVHGASVNSVFPYAWLFEWRDGALTKLAGLNSADSLRVSGNWAIYSAQEALGKAISLWRRDLKAGLSSLVTVTAGNVRNDVATNGEVVYWTSDYKILRWQGNSAQALSNDTSASIWNTYPVTDGVNVVYRKHTPCCNAQTYRLAVHDGLAETILSPATATEPAPGRSYAVAGGYIAYTVEDNTGASQIWRQNSAGKQQLTAFGSPSSIDGVGNDGTVLFTQKQARYRATPGAALQVVGSALGRTIERDGKFLVVLGSALLEVMP